jgi:hypothetical protein
MKSMVFGAACWLALLGAGAVCFMMAAGVACFDLASWPDSPGKVSRASYKPFPEPPWAFDITWCEPMAPMICNEACGHTNVYPPAEEEPEAR